MGDQPTVAELVALMQQAKAGNKESFGTLYRYYFLPIFRYTLKRVGNEKEAEDITQAVFMKIYTSKHTFTDTHTNPLAYFFTTARTIIVDRWKKDSRLDIISDESIIATELHVEQRKVELKMTLDQAVTKLPAEQQEVIKMKFVQGLETREIAAQLGKTEMAIRQIQCRALKKLREELSPSIF